MIINHAVGYRPTWAEINCRNLVWNFKQVKKIVGPSTKIMACVKADAYGHGLVPIARALVSCGADYLSVASVDEAIRLRDERITVPVVVLGAALKTDIEPLVRYRITPTICSFDVASALNRRAAHARKPLAIHVKVDTGMGRIGVLAHNAFGFVQRLIALKHLCIEGICTHLACTDTDTQFTRHQISLFNSLKKQLEAAGIRIAFFHAANSLGAIDYPESRFNMVRPGLVLYGLHPRYPLAVALRPVLALKTRVVFYKRVPKGYGISYGRTYVTRRPTTIVTVPLGYGDGYPRNLSNRAPVLIGARRFTISGRICMDQIMVDVGDHRIRHGQEVVLIGRQGNEVITAEALAGLADTIPYEIVCGLGSRVPRVYV
jgi:alanine racemase